MASPQGALAGLTALYGRLIGVFSHFDGVASLLLRLILGPVLIAANVLPTR